VRTLFFKKDQRSLAPRVLGQDHFKKADLPTSFGVVTSKAQGAGGRAGPGKAPSLSLVTDGQGQDTKEKL